MAKKSKTVFVCQSADMKVQGGWVSASAGAWNTMVEQKVIDLPEDDSERRTSVSRTLTRLKEVGSGDYIRIDTGIRELNRALGGGLVKDL